MQFKLAFARDKIIDPFVPFINTNSLLDHATGKYVPGMQGDMILNGGMAPLFGVQGYGNTFKSTIAHYITISAAASIALCGTMPVIECNDTENSLYGDRIYSISRVIDIFRYVDLVEFGAYRIKQAKDYPAEAWFGDLKRELLVHKMKDNKGMMTETPFMSDEGKPIVIPFPCFSEVDSLSHFKPSALIQLEEKADLGDSSGNTVFLRAGLYRSRFLNEVSTLCTKTGHYMMLTAHIGKKMEMASGPMAPKPTKDMMYMKTDEKTKNVPESFTFLPMVVIQTRARPALDKDREIEYLPEPKAQNVDHNDLNFVTMTFIRNKNSPSGTVLEFVVSQTEGILPTTSEFHFLRTKEQEGIIRSGGNYRLKILPDISFTKNEIRVKERDPEQHVFKRAMKITADFFQMRTLMRNLTTYPDFDEFVAKIEADWGWENILNTRARWSLDHYTNEVKPLSTYDIIRMYKGEWKPAWLEPKKK